MVGVFMSGFVRFLCRGWWRFLPCWSVFFGALSTSGLQLLSAGPAGALVASSGAGLVGGGWWRGRGHSSKRAGARLVALLPQPGPL